MSGIEATPGRAAAHAISLPYFEFREVLTIRQSDAGRFRTLDDLRGRRVAALGGTAAYDRLLRRRQTVGLQAMSYDDDVHPYSDLAAERIDGVVLDHVIAARVMRRVDGLVNAAEPVAIGHYVAVLARRDIALRNRVDDALRGMMRDGSLERIYRRWDVWDSEQKAFFADVLAGRVPPPVGREAAGSGTTAEPKGPDEVATISDAAARTVAQAAVSYLPALLNAALITVLLSALAMALAIACGLGIASGRIYGPLLLRVTLTFYVEAIRGTPLLLQLFVLYYGLSTVIRLPAFVAALLGLGLNYAAYESEVYRSALRAVSPAQLQAARTLGFGEWQIFRLVRAPQALRLAMAPMTNDFVALLKDSSLVSVITVVELTKQTSIFATNVGSWAVPGAICAALYLLLSLPLARLARSLERQWSTAT
jgi:polar amino acid transport system substrate-binding protein